jgi:hypothetical protein
MRVKSVPISKEIPPPVGKHFGTKKSRFSRHGLKMVAVRLSKHRRCKILKAEGKKV